jgi:hypothetical protein
MGLAAAFQSLPRGNAMARVGLVSVVVVWLASTGSLHRRLLTIGNPDLKGLAARLGAARIVLTGPQSDLNQYYFPGSERLGVNDLIRVSGRSRANGADYIVQGLLAPSEPDVGILALGFEYSERLDAWDGEGVSYIVYRQNRGSPGRRTHTVSTGLPVQGSSPR